MDAYYSFLATDQTRWSRISNVRQSERTKYQGMRLTHCQTPKRCFLPTCGKWFFECDLNIFYTSRTKHSEISISNSKTYKINGKRKCCYCGILLVGGFCQCSKPQPKASRRHFWRPISAEFCILHNFLVLVWYSGDWLMDAWRRSFD